MSNLLINGGTVVSMNPTRDIIADGAVAVEGNRIVEVGKASDLAPRHADKDVIDARNKVVLPGFIDAHNHPFHSLSKGIVDEGESTKRLYRVVFPFEAALTPEEERIGSLGTFIEMIRSGTTTFNDPDGIHAHPIGEAATEIGMRGILSRSTWDTFSKDWAIPERAIETTEQALELGEELVERWHGAENDRIRAWFSLRTLMTASDRLALGIKELADKYGVGIHAHESADRFGGEIMKKVWGMSGIERYRKLGMLDPNLFLVHMGFVTPDEIELLAENDVKVCHCPSANMFGGQGTVASGAFPRMIQKGMTIGLGTDAGAINGFVDMIRLMYVFVVAHREMGVDRDWMNAYKALEMATIEGARAVLWDDCIGSLEAGKYADIIVVGTDSPEWHPNPLGNPVAKLVYSADGRSVETVIIDGQVVMADGRITTIDETEVMKEVDTASTAVLGRLDMTVEPKWPVI